MRCVPCRRAEGTRFFRDGGDQAPRSVCSRPALASGSVQTRVEAREYTREIIPRGETACTWPGLLRFEDFFDKAFATPTGGRRKYQKSPHRGGFPRRARPGHTSKDGCILQNQ